ncbi:MAG: DUF305 domain-containing protein [Chitinophagales bacterium]
MKVKTSLLLMLMISSSIAILSSCNSSEKKTDETSDMDNMKNGTMDNMEHSNKMMEVMNKMMSHMDTMKMTLDFDHDFASMMIDHHQGAIDMAQIEITSGSDEKIKSMAQKIITSQKAEQEKLGVFLSSHKPGEHGDEHADKHGEGAHNDQMESMEMMMNKTKGMTMSGDTDKDFVMMMIPHHEAAVKMAEDELTHGHHDELKQMAQQMISAQNAEIKEFKMWLDQHK